MLARVEAEKTAREIRRKASTDYPLFAGEYLRIRTKSGAIAPLTLNRSQQFIHVRLQEQLMSTGSVRALILKGRQQGCSTYVGGRFYHRCSQHGGLRVFILTHEDPATQNLFDIVTRFHENMPAQMKPSTGVANAKELLFDQLDSGYRVGTAHTTGVGRSSTIQLFHGSEVPLWRNPELHSGGIMQAVPDEPGTEIILEGTGHGVGNWFHQKWLEAEKGVGRYIPIFTPWFFDDGYRAPVPEGFSLSADEKDYAALHGLDNEQMLWRRNKLVDLRDPLLFMQEYPATPAEAFQSSGHDSYITPLLVMRARQNSSKITGSGPLILGFDPAHTGTARSSLAWRRGRRVEKVVSRTGLDTQEGAGWLTQVIREDRPARVFIDVGGIGAGVYDQLKANGANVTPIDFGGKPFEPPPLDDRGEPAGGPANRRAEMWQNSKTWLQDPAGVSIPDSDSLQADACAPGYKYDGKSRLLLERKDEMRARGIPSPDEWDAVALTFAEPVSDTVSNFNRQIVYPDYAVA